MNLNFRYGYKFVARKPESVVIRTPEGQEQGGDSIAFFRFLRAQFWALFWSIF